MIAIEKHLDQTNKKFPTYSVKGIVDLVNIGSKPLIGQYVFLIDKSKKTVVCINKVVDKYKTLVYNFATNRTITVQNSKLYKSVMYVLDTNTGIYNSYDINLTKMNKDIILANVGKTLFGWLNTADLLKPEQRYNADGSLNLQNCTKGYRQFIRISKTELDLNVLRTSFQTYRFVNQITRQPYNNEGVDSFVSLNKSHTKMRIGSGALKGTWLKQENNGTDSNE